MSLLIVGSCAAVAVVIVLVVANNASKVKAEEKVIEADVGALVAKAESAVKAGTNSVISSVEKKL